MQHSLWKIQATEKVKDAILQRFDITEESYRQCFKAEKSRG